MLRLLRYKSWFLFFIVCLSSNVPASFDRIIHRLWQCDLRDTIVVDMTINTISDSVALINITDPPAVSSSFYLSGTNVIIPARFQNSDMVFRLTRLNGDEELLLQALSRTAIPSDETPYLSHTDGILIRLHDSYQQRFDFFSSDLPETDSSRQSRVMPIQHLWGFNVLEKIEALLTEREGTRVATIFHDARHVFIHPLVLGCIRTRYTQSIRAELDLSRQFGQNNPAYAAYRRAYEGSTHIFLQYLTPGQIDSIVNQRSGILQRLWDGACDKINTISEGFLNLLSDPDDLSLPTTITNEQRYMGANMKMNRLPTATLLALFNTMVNPSSL